MSNDTTIDDNRLKSTPSSIQGFKEIHELGLDNPRMEEVAFPSFLEALYNKETGKFNLNVWYETFREYRHGLDVINGEGEIVEQCPSPIGISETVFTSDGVDGYSYLLESTKLVEKRNGQESEQYFREAAMRKDLPEMHKVTAKWISILIKYGLIDTIRTPNAVNDGEMDFLSMDSEDI